MESSSREMGSLGLGASWSSLHFAPLSFPFDRMSSLSLYSIKILTLSHYSLYPFSFPSLQNYSYAHHTNHSKLTLLLPPPFSLSLSLSLATLIVLSLPFLYHFFVSVFHSFLYLCSHFATLQLRNPIMLLPITLFLSSELQFVDKMI